MNEPKLKGVFIGLAITSTWGNGHATTYRALLREFAALGHEITFVERNVPWYEEHREFREVRYCEVGLYDNVAELQETYGELIRTADFVVVGSYVPEGIAIGDWVLARAEGIKAFYDIDTPITISSLEAGKCEYLSQRQVSKYDLYLSFTGGPTLSYLEKRWLSPAARALYCSVDPLLYFPEAVDTTWDLAYLGTYAEDRQTALQELLLRTAQRESHRRFAVAGPRYPEGIEWPGNVERFLHLAASEHRRFYNSQAFTLNLTRRDMVKSGYSPSVRLFEAAACGVPIMSDEWPGLSSIFTPGLEILQVSTSDDVVRHLQLPLEQRALIGEDGRKRTLRFHSAAVRARELQSHIVAAQERVSHQMDRSKTGASLSETAGFL